MRAHMTGVITLCAFLLVANGGVEAAAVGEDAVAPMGAAELVQAAVGETAEITGGEPTLGEGAEEAAEPESPEAQEQDNAKVEVVDAKLAELKETSPSDPAAAIKAKVLKAKLTRKKARAELRKEGMDIPASLEKGSFEKDRKIPASVQKEIESEIEQVDKAAEQPAAPQDAEPPKDEAAQDKAPQDAEPEPPKDEAAPEGAPKDEAAPEEAPKDEATPDEAKEREIDKDEATPDESKEREIDKDEMPTDAEPEAPEQQVETPKDPVDEVDPSLEDKAEKPRYTAEDHDRDMGIVQSLTLKLHMIDTAITRGKNRVIQFKATAFKAQKAGNSDSEYDAEDLVKVNNAQVAQQELRKLRVTHRLQAAKKRLAQGADNALAVKKQAQEQMAAATEKMAKVQKIQESNTDAFKKAKAEAKIAEAQASSTEARQYARVATHATSVIGHRMTATRKAARKTENIAMKALDAAKAAAESAADAMTMAQKHKSEVDASIESRAEMFQRHLEKYTIVADQVGKSKIERGTEMVRETGKALKVIKKRLDAGKKELDEFKKKYDKENKYLTATYKAKNTTSAMEKLSDLLKKQARSLEREQRKNEDLREFEMKEQRHMKREEARGKHLKGEGEAMMKAPKAEAREASQKAMRANIHKKERIVKAAEIAKSQAEYESKKHKEKHMFDVKIEKSSAELAENLKKTQIALAKAEGKLAAETKRMKKAGSDPFRIAKAEKKKEKKEGAAAKKEVKAEKKKAKAEKKLKKDEKKEKKADDDEKEKLKEKVKADKAEVKKDAAKAAAAVTELDKATDDDSKAVAKEVTDEKLDEMKDDEVEEAKRDKKTADAVVKETQDKLAAATQKDAEEARDVEEKKAEEKTIVAETKAGTKASEQATEADDAAAKKDAITEAQAVEDLARESEKLKNDEQAAAAAMGTATEERMKEAVAEDKVNVAVAELAKTRSLRKLKLDSEVDKKANVGAADLEKADRNAAVKVAVAEGQKKDADVKVAKAKEAVKEAVKMQAQAVASEEAALGDYDNGSGAPEHPDPSALQVPTGLQGIVDDVMKDGKGGKGGPEAGGKGGQGSEVQAEQATEIQKQEGEIEALKSEVKELKNQVANPEAAPPAPESPDGTPPAANAQQVKKTKALRKAARKALRADGKRIPQILKKGTLDQMLRDKQNSAVPTSPVRLGEDDSFDQEDLDKDKKTLNTELQAIEKKTDTSHIEQAKRLPEVEDDADVAGEAAKMGRKDAQQQSELDSAAKGSRPESLATQKVLDTARAAAKKTFTADAAKNLKIKVQLRKVGSAAKKSAKAQDKHARKIESGNSRLNRKYSDLMHERNNMPDYTVTADIHHSGELGEAVDEQQDGDTLASMKKALSQTKAEAAAEVKQAQDNALLAVNKIKHQVEMLKEKMTATKENSQKKQASAVRHVAGKAMLAVNAAKLASALTGGPGGDPEKKALIAKVAADKAAASKATRQWQQDAGKLARLEKAHLVKAKAAVRAVEKSGVHAQHNLKQANRVTETIKELPTTVSADASALESESPKLDELRGMVDAHNAKPKAPAGEQPAEKAAPGPA
jgi:hypothetical protein